MVSKVKQTILAVGIALILAFFVGYGIQTFYRGVNMQDFCNEGPMVIENQAQCEKSNGKWTEPQILDEGLKLTCNMNADNSYTCYSDDPQKQRGYCDMSSCYDEYRKVMAPYNRNVFIIATVIGLIALFIGVSLKLGSVSAGLMGGGVLTIIYGVIRYWGDAEDWLRFVILGVALAALIWIGYKKLNPSEPKPQTKPVVVARQQKKRK